MKRRHALAGRNSFDPLTSALASAVESILDRACADRRIAARLEEGSLLPAALTRQALALAFRSVYELLEQRESNCKAATRDAGFPAVPEAAPDLDGFDVGGLLGDAERFDLEGAAASLSADAIDADALGEALARLSTTPFVRHDAIRASEVARVRDAGGTFFTPPALVDRLLDATLEPLLDERLAGRSRAAREAALLDLAVVDPACGSGRFLLAAASRVAKRLVVVRQERGDADVTETSARADVAERCLWGVDVDPLAIEALRFRLRREMLRAGRNPTSLRKQTICGDATLDVDWERTIDDRSRPASGFDVVLGNPPWISYSGRHRGGASAKRIERLVARYPEIASWPSLHSATLALATRIVAPAGNLGFVLPLRVADLEGYADLRLATTRRLRLVGKVVDVDENAFEGVTQPAGLFAFRAGSEQVHASAAPWPIDAPEGRSSSRPRPRNFDDARIEELLVELDSQPKFPPKTFGDPGVHTGNVARKVIAADPSLSQPLLREGCDLRAYFCRAPRLGLRQAIEFAPGEYCRVGKLDRYLDTPILLRQTADRPIAARHVERTYFRNSLLACAGVPGVPDEVVVAFLNSALYALLHRRNSGDARQRTFPQVKVAALQQLPHPPFEAASNSSENQSLLIELSRHALLAERAAASTSGFGDELAISIERLVLRTFGADEDLAPLLIALVRKLRRERALR